MVKGKTDRFFVMLDFFQIVHEYYNLNDDHVIEYLNTKSTPKIEYLIKCLEKGGEDEKKVLYDFSIWEDEHITKIELLKNMLQFGDDSYNGIEIMQFLNTLSISERNYFCNCCLIDEICEEFERWRSKNELSQNN